MKIEFKTRDKIVFTPNARISKAWDCYSHAMLATYTVERDTAYDYLKAKCSICNKSVLISKHHINHALLIHLRNTNV